VQLAITATTCLWLLLQLRMNQGNFSGMLEHLTIAHRIDPDFCDLSHEFGLYHLVRGRGGSSFCLCCSVQGQFRGGAAAAVLWCGVMLCCVVVPWCDAVLCCCVVQNPKNTNLQEASRHFKEAILCPYDAARALPKLQTIWQIMMSNPNCPPSVYEDVAEVGAVPTAVSDGR
jgi:hypothetical protein